MRKSGSIWEIGDTGGFSGRRAEIGCNDCWDKKHAIERQAEIRLKRAIDIKYVCYPCYEQNLLEAGNTIEIGDLGYVFGYKNIEFVARRM